MADESTAPFEKLEVLTGPENFQAWSRRLKCHALKYDVWGILTGAEAILEEPKLKDFYQRLQMSLVNVSNTSETPLCGLFWKWQEAQQSLSNPFIIIPDIKDIPSGIVSQVPGFSEDLQLFKLRWEMWREQDKRISLARGLLSGSVNDKYNSLIQGFPNSAEAMEVLRQVNATQSQAAAIDAHKKLESLTLADCDDALDFFHQLEALRAVVQDGGISYTDGKLKLKILQSLPSEYRSFVCRYWQYEDNRYLDEKGLSEVKMQVLSEESRIKGKKSLTILEEEEEEDQEYASASEPIKKHVAQQDKPEKGSVQKFALEPPSRCTWCGRRGHSEDECWHKHPMKKPFGRQSAIGAALRKQSWRKGSEDPEGDQLQGGVVPLV